ncbi:MAG: hypothetical protein WKF43_05250 [Acidimicrobiales bacterium]
MAMPVGRSAVRPTGWWYLGALGIGGLGLLIAVLVLANGFGRTERIEREVTVVELGRSGPVTFEKGGGYTLSYQGPPRARTEADVVRLAAELDPVLRPAGGGPAIPMRPYEGTNRIVNRPGAQLVPVLTFEIERLGDYVLRVERLEGVAENFGQVSVGKSALRSLLGAVVWAVVVLGVSLFLSGVATVALAVTRGRSKRQAGERGPGRERSLAAGPVGAAPTRRRRLARSCTAPTSAWLPGRMRRAGRVPTRGRAASSHRGAVGSARQHRRRRCRGPGNGHRSHRAPRHGGRSRRRDGTGRRRRGPPVAETGHHAALPGGLDEHHRAGAVRVRTRSRSRVTTPGSVSGWCRGRRLVGVPTSPRA